MSERDNIMWLNLDVMQKRIMAADSQTTKAEFFAQPREAREKFYTWMKLQCPGFSCFL